MVPVYPAPLASGDTTIMPMGTSPPSLSSHVMNRAPLFLKADDASIFGTSVDSHLSPFATSSSCAHPRGLCMSSQRFGVMKL